MGGRGRGEVHDAHSSDSEAARPARVNSSDCEHQGRTVSQFVWLLAPIDKRGWDLTSCVALIVAPLSLSLLLCFSLSPLRPSCFFPVDCSFFVLPHCRSGAARL